MRRERARRPERALRVPIYQVDAFASRVFEGNPAAVCPLERWLDDATMQRIAAENNLAETAFFVPGETPMRIRWFTPVREIDLCGHATLASAFVLFERLGAGGDTVGFESKSGPLAVRREDGRLVMDLPAWPPRPVADLAPLERALGRRPLEAWASRDLLAVFAREADVRALVPDFAAVASLEALGVIATAPGDACDFVSRFFVPGAGIPEDPATGSSHCTLVPYWAGRLGRARLAARQVSARGGEMECELRGDRVSVGGRAVLYLEGWIVT